MDTVTIKEKLLVTDPFIPLTKECWKITPIHLFKIMALTFHLIITLSNKKSQKLQAIKIPMLQTLIYSNPNSSMIPQYKISKKKKLIRT
jgi:hypothetical protein